MRCAICCAGGLQSPRITWTRWLSATDRTSEQTVECLLGLLAASHESQQQQTAARVLDALALSLPRLASPDRRRLAEALQEAAPLIAAGAWAPMLRAAGERISGVLMELGWPAAAEALRAGFRREHRARIRLEADSKP